MAKLIITRHITVTENLDVGDVPEEQAVDSEKYRSATLKRQDALNALHSNYSWVMVEEYKYIPDDDEDYLFDQYLQTDDAQEQIRAHNEEMAGLNNGRS